MALRESKGNMYPFVDFTWNPIKGECSHQCSYCYCKCWGKQSPLHLDEKELRTDLGSGKFIFVGSSTDMWAEAVPLEWINRVLYYCQEYPGNTYLFQSKNPERFPFYPDVDLVYGTTIETNRWYRCMGSYSQLPGSRAERMRELAHRGRRTMVTIEPILDFDLPALVALVRTASPEWVNVGADSKGHGLPEPGPDKVRELIRQLRDFTEVKLKSNLGRIVEMEER